MLDHEHNDRSDSLWGVAAGIDPSGRNGKLGRMHDQDFYAVRHFGGNRLSIPFPPRPFNALIDVPHPIPESILGEISLQLLQHGMRSAICSGLQGERLGEILDEIIDEHGFYPNNRTVYTSVHLDEPIEETLDYFVLPNGLADTGLIVVVGDEHAFGEVVKTFLRLTREVREYEAIPI